MKRLEAERQRKKLRELYAKHVDRYERGIALARAGDTSYSEAEGLRLLKLWRELALRGFEMDALSDEAREEVEDALDEDEELRVLVAEGAQA